MMSLANTFEFFVSDYGSNLFSLKFTRAMKVVNVMCEDEMAVTWVRSEMVPGCQEAGLHAMVKNNREFVWEQTYTKILEALTAKLKDNTTLQYFDPQKEIVIECDASQKGLGACLLQDGKPVNFSSTSFIDAETRNCNLECKVLTVAWAVNHYWQYAYGQRFKIVSDHSPLQQIVKKDIRDTTTGLQWLLLWCQGYDFTIEYKKGVEINISDCPSRYVPPPAPNQGPEFPATSQIGIFEVTAASESDIQKIQPTQKKDPVFQGLEYLCHQGWPEHCN